MYVLIFVLDDSEHVFAGRWRHHKDTLRKHTWETLQVLACVGDDLITFDPEEFGDEVHIVTVDCVNFIVQEPRGDPSTKWFDQKSHSAGKFSQYSQVA